MKALLKSKGADDAKDIFNEVQSDPRYAALRPWAVGLDCVEMMEKPLAKGASGAVHRGFLYERVVACKVLADITVQSVDSFLTEASLLSECSHPSIIQLIGVCLDAREPVGLASEAREEQFLSQESTGLTELYVSFAVYHLGVRERRCTFDISRKRSASPHSERWPPHATCTRHTGIVLCSRASGRAQR